MTQFQNCAPVEPGQYYDVSHDELPADQGVRIIDRIGDQKIEFEHTYMTIDEARPTSVRGLCVGNESLGDLAWQLVERVGDEAVVEGLVACERGEFHLSLAETSKLKCNVEYQIMARTIQGADASTFIMRECGS